MYHVIGLSIKEALKLKVGDTIDVFEDGPRPTALNAAILTKPKLQDNPCVSRDYYCEIDVDGHAGICRLTFADLWEDPGCSFCD